MAGYTINEKGYLMPEVLVFSNPPDSREELRRKGYSEAQIEHLLGRRINMADLSSLKNLAGMGAVGTGSFLGAQYAKNSLRAFLLKHSLQNPSGKAFGLIQNDKGKVASYYSALAGSQAVSGIGITMLSDWAAANADKISPKMAIPSDLRGKMKTAGYVGTALSVLTTLREYMQVNSKTVSSVIEVEQKKIEGKPLTSEKVNALGAYYELGGSRSRRVGSYFQLPKPKKLGAFFEQSGPLGCCNQPVGSRVGSYGTGRVPTGEDVVRYALSS